MARTPTDLSLLFADTAAQKQAAAKARVAGGASDAEAPREVYLAACMHIAESLAGEGFIFRKSGPKAVQAKDGLHCSLWFQSDRNNIAGVHVGMLIHVQVERPALKAFAKELGIPRPQGHLGGGQIGNLVQPPGWWKWQLADPASRESEIADASAAVHDIALPFFDAFRDPERLARRCLEGDELAISPGQIVLHLLSLGLQDDAIAVGKTAIARMPRGREVYVRTKATPLVAEPLSNIYDHTAALLGQIAKVCSLDFL